MIPDIHLVIHLQDLDKRIADLEKEVAALPKHISQIEKALEGHNRRLEADRAALTANQKERKKLEGDIQMQEQKVSKLRDQMLQAKTNDQYRAFQNEIDYCQNEVRKAEDRILDLMGESEPLEANVKKAEAALKEEKKSVDAEKVKAHESTAQDQKELSALQAERRESAEKLPQAVHREYERILKKWHGWAVAEVVEGRCTGCQIVLRPQYFQEVRRGDAILQCESCGRLLYYHPPVNVEEAMAMPPTPRHM
jgi:uncharacterized protein